MIGRLLLILLFCYPILNGQTSTNIMYAGSDAIFPNPERGFHTSTSSPISVTQVENLRQESITLIHRNYDLGDFINSSISDDLLTILEEDAQTVRDGGAKLVVRFAYSWSQNEPDAPLTQILTHIAQLGPYFQSNYDIICFVEAGFIGAWGEWHSSSNNLDNTDDRRTVLFALLDVLPDDRMVAIRTPGYKKAIYNNDQPLTMSEAFNQTNRARTGAHNDCFLASANDYGTYTDIAADKHYLNLDNRFVPQGGETCSSSPYSNCDSALVALEQMRWSAINRDYNQEVLSEWESGGCIEEIKRRLGYRFRLVEATVQDSARPGGSLQFDFTIVNDGWASPFNPRNFELVLRHMITGEEYYLVSDEDPRFWLSDSTVQFTVIGGIPAAMPAGQYAAFVHLADPIVDLHPRPEFAIQLANTGVWEPLTGYNSLLFEVNIDSNADGPAYTGSNYFSYNSNYNAIADFAADVTSGFHPLTVQFTDLSLTPDTISAWRWDFDLDGIVDSYDQNPVWVYHSVGCYSVQLTIDFRDTSLIHLKENYITVRDSITGSDIITIDGDFSDWQNVPQFDLPPNPLEETDDFSILGADLEDLWVTHSADSIYMWAAFNVDGEISSVHSQGAAIELFIDADMDNSTGQSWGYMATGFEYWIVLTTEHGLGWQDWAIPGGTQATYGIAVSHDNGSSYQDTYHGCNVRYNADDNALELAIPIAAFPEIQAGFRFIFLNEENSTWTNDAYPNDLEQETADYYFSNTSVVIPPNMPQKFVLHPNYPNPFNPTTTIFYDLPEQTRVKLVIYDLLGVEVAVLVNEIETPGYKVVQWDGTNEKDNPVSAGVYFYRLSAGEYSQTNKMILLK